MGLTGTEAAEKLKGLSGKARDAAVLAMVNNDDVPLYLRKNWWKWVTIERNGHVLRYLVAPDYFAVGTDDDPLRVPVRPETLEAIAEHYDAILPSRAMIRDIEAAADTKIPFLDVKGAPYHIPLTGITSWDAIIAANNMANTALDKAGVAPGDGIVIGYAKSVVSAPNQDGSHVYIVGGRCKGSGIPCAKAPWQDEVQEPMNGHSVDWVDDSQKGTLVSIHGATLDGDPVDLIEDVFMSKDPKIVELVSDQGRFRPEYPNTGANAVTPHYSVTGAPGASGAGSSGAPNTGSSGMSTGAKVGITAGLAALGLVIWAAA